MFLIVIWLRSRGECFHLSTVLDSCMNKGTVICQRCSDESQSIGQVAECLDRQISGSAISNSTPIGWLVLQRESRGLLVSRIVGKSLWLVKW